MFVGGIRAYVVDAAVVSASCACALLLVVFRSLARASTRPGRMESLAWNPSDDPSRPCSLDSLSFYYDDDGELQCLCPDDLEDQDDYLALDRA